MIPGGRQVAWAVGWRWSWGKQWEVDWRETWESRPLGGAELGHLGGEGGATWAGVWEVGPHQPDGQAAAFPPSNQR